MRFYSFAIFLFIAAGCNLQAGGWSPAVTLSSENSTNPAVAMDSGSNAVCVWENSDGATTCIQAAVCPANGNWTQAATISDSCVLADDPVVFYCPNGDAMAFWSFQGAVGSYEIQYATLPKGSKSWVLPSQPFATSDGELFTPRIAFDSQGNALAVWSETKGQGDSETTLLKTARLAAGSSSWEPLEDLEQSYETDSIYFGFDRAGNALMTWKHYTNASGTVSEILSATLASDATSWTMLQSLYNKYGPVVTKTVFDGAGYAVNMWNNVGSIHALTYTFGDSSWKETTFPNAFTIHNVSLDLNQKDKSVAIMWIDYNTNAVYCSTLDKSKSSWTTPTTLLAPSKNHLQDQSIRFDSLGNAVAIWTDNTQNLLQAVTQSFGKPWSTPTTLCPFERHNMFPYWSGWPEFALSNGNCVVAIPQWADESQDAIQAVKGANLFKKARMKGAGWVPRL